MRVRCLVLLTSLIGCAAPTVDDGDTVNRSDAVEGAYRAAVAELPCPGEDDDAAAARRAIARVRALAGLSPLRCDPAAASAARGHCRYVVVNQQLTHTQDPKRPAFTGVTVNDRLARARFADLPGGEVLANVRGAAAIEGRAGFLNSVYHRAVFLRPEATSFGYAAEPGCATIDFGRARSRVADVNVVWPPDGASNVPASFAAARELPNPVPGSTIVGAPVTLIRARAIRSVRVQVTGPSGAVDGVLLTQRTDPNKLVHDTDAHFVPRAPLAAGATYHARFTVDDDVVETTFETAR